MSKKFVIPMLSINKLNINEDDGEVTGGGTAQSSTDIEPYDWEMWSVMFEEDDSDGNGIPGTWDDYVKWMTDNGFEDYISWDQMPNP